MVERNINTSGLLKVVGCVEEISEPSSSSNIANC